MARLFPARATLWLAVSTAAVVTASPLQAQAFGWSKSEAILGGAPSALEAIVAQQQGLPAPKAPSVQPASYQPAAYGDPMVIPAVLRRPAVSPGVLNGKPDVFGSVALRVGNTRLDARWHRVDKIGRASCREGV